MTRTARHRGLLAAVLLASAMGLLAAPVLGIEPVEAGLDDLVVFEPGVHERGLPAVQFTGDDDGLNVEIPPTVHVHRYYYSGDKEFQGPLINGGPTVVVANHPKTGKRMLVDVMLPAGAPRIAHNKHGITYIYKDKRVEVRFQCFPFDPDTAVVKHYSGRGLGRNLHDAHEHVKQHTKEHLANSTAVDSVKESAGGAHDFLKGLKVASGDMVARGSDSLKTLTNMVPGVVYVKSLAEQKANKDYSNAVRQAGREKERLEAEFVPTNR